MKMIIRNTHHIDAKGVALGRLATQIAILLIGKHKKEYQPNRDQGDKVVVQHAKEIRLSGKKLLQKHYYRHSQYLGGLKTETLQDVMLKKPQEALKKAVYGMLPKNTFRKVRFLRLKID